MKATFKEDTATVQLDTKNFDEIVMVSPATTPPLGAFRLNISVYQDEEKDVLVGRFFPPIHLASTFNSDCTLTPAFTAPWCGYCKRLMPTYELAAAAFQPEPNCVFANFNAHDTDNRPLATKYGIEGYPTLLFFPKGSIKDKGKDKVAEDYDGGDTTESDLVEFMNEKCGTHRAVGGGVDEYVRQIMGYICRIVHDPGAGGLILDALLL